MSDLTSTLKFAVDLYRAKAATAYAGYVRRDQLALLGLRPGRANPYAIYERLRADGALSLTRQGEWVSTSHRVCDEVLRDRRFGVNRNEQDPDAFDVSFLEMISSSSASSSCAAASRRTT
jgi:cytochrome P450